MPNRTSLTGSELFIVDNSITDWKVLKYLHDWCRISKAIDIATGYFEIGALPFGTNGRRGRGSHPQGERSFLGGEDHSLWSTLLA
jgi:hypothetical protein